MRNWMIGLAGVAVVAVAAPAVAQVNWAWVNDRTERFTVELPGAATKKNEAVGESKLATVAYEVELPSGFYTVASTTVPANPTPEQVEAGLDASIDGAVAVNSGVLTWKRTATVSGRSAREAEYTMTTGGVNMRGRVLVTYREQRLYSLVTLEDVGEPSGKAERVVRSFRLLD